MKPATDSTHKEILIWIVEDDPLQAECLRETIERKLAAAGVSLSSVQISMLETECEFRRNFEEARTSGRLPNAIICDVMLPWAYPGAEGFDSPPAEMSGHDAYRDAGIRCFSLMSEEIQSARLRPVPWLFRTILSKERMKYEQIITAHKEASDSTYYVSKESGMDEVCLWVLGVLFGHESAVNVSAHLTPPKMAEPARQARRSR